MSTIFSQFRQANRDFRKNWFNYLLLFIGLSLANQLVFIPLFRFLATYILQKSAIPFLSIQNVYLIITQHTGAFICLLLELMLLLMVVYLQMAYILIGIKEIRNGQFSFKEIIKFSLQKLKNIRFGSIFLLILYLLLVIPFAGLVFRTPLLAKVQIPVFIIEYMLNSLALSLILIGFYLVFLYLGIRLIYVLPIMIFEDMKTLPAMRKSWQMSRTNGIFKLLLKIVLVSFVSLIILIVAYLIICFWQLVCDTFSSDVDLAFAIINMLLIQTISEIVLVWTSVVTLLILFYSKDPSSSNIRPKSHHHKKRIAVLTIFSIILVSFAVLGDSIYLLGLDDKNPVVISHRGVNDENGVQNTIPALEKTVKEKPDYVEIDLHETKDHQFIVMHDENLKKLTGVNKIPHDLTLKQLTDLTAKENGYSAKLASFDQYLAAAEKYKQKLLVEIKTTPHDSPDMYQNFNRKYGQRILKNKHQLQSIDYRAVEKLKAVNPKFFVLYIQPYNFTYPISIANGYSMEYSTLNSDFIFEANLNKQPVYAWTVNSASVMARMMYDNIDGLITDNVTLAKEEIKNYKDSKSYANRLANYLMVESSLGKMEP